jgi:hypothetical protein
MLLSVTNFRSEIPLAMVDGFTRLVATATFELLSPQTAKIFLKNIEVGTFQTAAI